MWKQFKANEKEDRETEKNSTNYKEPQVINKIKKKQQRVREKSGEICIIEITRKKESEQNDMDE